MQLLDLLEKSPVIAAVKEKEGLNRCFQTDCRVVFILFGSICDIAEIVGCIKGQGRTAIVHVDLIAGLGTKEVALISLKASHDIEFDLPDPAECWIRYCPPTPLVPTSSRSRFTTSSWWKRGNMGMKTKRSTV